MVAGGETIRDICRQSGAHVELNRDNSLNQLERIFRIQGSPDQMQNAIRLICERAGIVCTLLIAPLMHIFYNSVLWA